MFSMPVKYSKVMHCPSTKSSNKDGEYKIRIFEGGGCPKKMEV